MTIQEFLLRYRKPLFAPNDGAGAGGDAGAGAGGEGAAGGDAGTGGDAAAAAGGDTAPGADGADTLTGADGADTAEGADGKDGEDGADGDETPGEFTLQLAEGQEQFQADADAFATDVNKWKADNPTATVDDAFKWAAERQASLVAEQTAELSQSFERQVDNWEAEAKADKEYGGDKYAENSALAKEAIDTYGTDGLKEVLDTSGLGSHPEVIRFALKVGQALKDAPVIKGKGDATTKNATQRIYPNG